MQNPFQVDQRDLLSQFWKEHPAAPILKKLAAEVPKLYLVGGFVRDALRGELSHDVDLEVYGVLVEKLETLLNQLFPGQIHSVGKAFGIFRIPAGSGFVDIALPRRESKSGSGHKGFVVEGDPNMTVEEATRRRDFTVNAMLIDVKDGTLVDPFGGKKDLDEKRLRVVDPKTFVDDPLRVYRAIQLAARLDFAVEPKSFELMHSMVARGDLATLSKERVTDEIRKLILMAEKPSIGWTLARELGIIERDYPELQALIGTKQEPEWHPEGDVWVHSLMVIDEAARIIRDSARSFSEREAYSVVLGSFCHDLGKPATTQVIDGRIRSRGHEEAGIIPTKSLLARWTFSSEILHNCVIAASEHLKPGMLYREHEKGAITDAQYRNGVRRLIRRTHPTPWRVLLAVAEADWRGRGIPGTRDPNEPYEYGKRFRETVSDLEAHQDLLPLLEGRDLLALGIEPGPRVGELLREVETARDNGDVKTRDEAIVWIKTRI
ncbi:MAG: hypothetical protein WC787_04340 [Patescibacteria group bacterium]|jgi:tRNA nucleotidyltransferase (CCA-adding enzyme)